MPSTNNNQSNYNKEYTKWINSLTPAERAALPPDLLKPADDSTRADKGDQRLCDDADTDWSQHPKLSPHAIIEHDDDIVSEAVKLATSALSKLFANLEGLDMYGWALSRALGFHHHTCKSGAQRFQVSQQYMYQLTMRVEAILSTKYKADPKQYTIREMAGLLGTTYQALRVQIQRMKIYPNDVIKKVNYYTQGDFELIKRWRAAHSTPVRKRDFSRN